MQEAADFQTRRRLEEQKRCFRTLFTLHSIIQYQNKTMTEKNAPRNVIVVGNTAERIGSEQRWRWKVFVDATNLSLDAAIAGVALTLHPTFREPHQTLHLAESSLVPVRVEAIHWMGGLCGES